ncbi:hypothetical protein HDU91_002996, partial [Kappamyces sp. JEL0680]
AFLCATSGGETSAIRQEIKAILVKFLERLKRAMYRNTKEISQLSRKLLKTPAPDKRAQFRLEVDALQLKLDEKKLFIHWFHQMSFGSLYPGAALFRTMSGLSFLTLLHQIDELPIDQGAGTVDAFTVQLTTDDADVFLSRLLFHYTKQEPLEYLKSVNLPFETTPASFHAQLHKAKSLLASLRAKDVDAGTALALFLHLEHVQKKGVVPSGASQSDAPSISYLYEFVSLLDTHLGIAKTNLVRATQQYPMNGVFSAVHLILQQIDVNELNDSWKPMLERIADIAKTACLLTAEVVSNPSPEGNIPEEEDLHSMEHVGVPQILLRDCFRTIKEATACLSQIALMMESISSAYAFAYIRDLGVLFAGLLTRIRHRGAFASCEENFAKICAILGKSADGSSMALLDSWLE